MTYRELYETATRMLQNKELTSWEFAQMVAPLDSEIIGYRDCRTCEHCQISADSLAEAMTSDEDLDCYIDFESWAIDPTKDALNCEDYLWCDIFPRT